MTRYELAVAIIAGITSGKIKGAADANIRICDEPFVVEGFDNDEGFMIAG